MYQPKNHRKRKKTVVKQNWSLKVCHRAWQRSNDKSKPWSFGVGCFVEFAARPVDLRNQGFKKKDIKGVGDWCPGKLDVTFPFVHFWMVFEAGPWVLGVAHVWYRFAKLTPQPRVWCDLVDGPIIYQNAKLLIQDTHEMQCTMYFYIYIHTLLYIYMCVELYDLCANYKIYKLHKLHTTWLMSYIVKN